QPVSADDSGGAAAAVEASVNDDLFWECADFVRLEGERPTSRLQRTYGIVDPSDRQAAVQTMKISGHPKGLMRFLSTHPPLETRIARLKMLA
ncbi:MAG TPA: hypothetical protein PKA62_16030, partial [Thermoanaerobaculia bacterium]|nr:hypothetical protein [Thermoanaerobaculia bacterium]